MDEAVYEEQLRRRLALLESPDRETYLVADLPLVDILVVTVTLVVATAGLLWWAY